MKHFPLKIAILCLMLAPILYVATLNLTQKYLDSYYFQNIENIFIGDTSKLLNGRAVIEEQISDNINTFLKNDKIIGYLDFDLKILITTYKGRIIYPSFISAGQVVNNLPEHSDFAKIAKQNFDILNSGLQISIVKTTLNHGTKIANLILFVYLSIAIAVFSFFYKTGSSRAKLDTKLEKTLINDFQKDELIHKQMLENMKKERQGLFENIKSLHTKYQKDKNKLKINEEELFDEIISLEEQINFFVELKKKKEEEIDELKSQIRKYERRKSSKNKRNEFDFVFKRFVTLYKNLEMNRRSITGLLDLGEDQQIKAEEIVFLLNQNQKNVTIKRKVFSGKKHRAACFEVLFAYNGRLYFRKNENNKVEILIIGTKNTQKKDMEFLHSL